MPIPSRSRGRGPRPTTHCAGVRATPAPPPAAAAGAARAAHRGEGAASGRRSVVDGPRGRLVGDRAPDGAVGSIAVTATVREAAVRRAERGADAVLAVQAEDVREAVRRER